MFTKNNPAIGARPGTLAIPENSPEPRIRVTQYSSDEVEVFDIEDVSTLPALVKSDFVTWVDIQGFGNEEKLRGVAAAFGLASDSARTRGQCAAARKSGGLRRSQSDHRPSPVD